MRNTAQLFQKNDDNPSQHIGTIQFIPLTKKNYILDPCIDFDSVQVTTRTSKRASQHEAERSFSFSRRRKNAALPGTRYMRTRPSARDSFPRRQNGSTAVDKATRERERERRARARKKRDPATTRCERRDATRGKRGGREGKKCDTIEQKAAVSSLSEWKKSATRWNERSIKRGQKGNEERKRQVKKKERWKTTCYLAR